MKKSVVDPRYDESLEKARRKNPPLDEVARLLEAAHEAGDARATYALATWYLHGKYFDKNLRRAVALLREAAEGDVPDAVYDLAVCYEQGEGVARNERRAVELYVKAALLGEKQSVYEVGRCYYYGIGVEKNRRIARVWLDRAKQLRVD
ncbi:MAG TPA: tetratricopeptide repeat protein [Thermoanaerobaculia bacterium]|jgi:TPR repeat protein|nr:tetratricopeptide repeat protein [Thermoanaerobaculia bacterium]